MSITSAAQNSEYPSYSQDGMKLAYVRFDADDRRRRSVVVRDMQSIVEQEIFASPFGLNNLSWTADNESIVLYSIDAEGWNNLYAARADGSGTTRMTFNTVTDTYSAEYSPDGKSLLFSQGSEDSPYHRWYNYDLYEKELASGAVQRLTWSLGSDDRGHYSPDGMTIGYVSRRSGYSEIYLMDAGGGNLRAITAQPAAELGRYVRTNGLPAGLSHYEAIRRVNSSARLFNEFAAFVLVRQLIAEGRLAESVALGRLGVDSYPDSWRTMTALGEALLASGDRAGAHLILRDSLAEFPNQVSVYFLLGFNEFFDILSSIDGIWEAKGAELFELVNWLQRQGATRARNY